MFHTRDVFYGNTLQLVCIDSQDSSGSSGVPRVVLGNLPFINPCKHTRHWEAVCPRTKPRHVLDIPGKKFDASVKVLVILIIHIGLKRISYHARGVIYSKGVRIIIIVDAPL